LLRRRGRREDSRWLDRRWIAARSLAFFVVAAAALLVVPGASAAESITPIIYGTPGANGWYVSNVTVNWKIDPLPASSTGCDARTLTADTPGIKVTCSATWSDGTTITVGKTFKIDKTPPAVTAAPSRAADANGWYNHPLSISFSGTDATSGLAGCSSGAYGGPDNPTAAVSGNCHDNAGNIGSAALWFKYDATPPSVSSIAAKNGNRRIDLRWKASPDTQLVEVTRAPGIRGAGVSVVYRGPAASYRDTALKVGARYHYVVTAIDPADNRAAKSFAATATGALLSPLPSAKVGKAPLLVWAPHRRASYYNVQLMRGGRKILSVWVTRPRFQLRRAWVFNGRRYRLRGGVYHWYVWPGFGLFSAGRYGRLLGGSSFVYTG
jgi:hypothetical protein